MDERGDRVVAPGRPRVAAGDPAHGEPAAAEAAVHRHRLQRVGRAGGVVAAHLAVERADREPVATQQADQDVLHGRRRSPAALEPVQRPVQVVGRARRTTPSAAAGGPGPRARQSPAATRVAPGPGVGVGASPGSASPRGPTALLTTNPTRGPVRPAVSVRGDGRGAGPASGCRLAARVRIAGANSRLEVAAGSARGQHRRARRVRNEWTRGSDGQAACGPCGGARTGWSGPRGCASAGGNRASCDDDGCSAGTYACSRVDLRVSGSGQDVSDREWCVCRSAGTAHPRETASPGERACGCPWTCGTGRHRFDRPTVRGAVEGVKPERSVRAPDGHVAGGPGRCTPDELGTGHIARPVSILWTTA